MRHQGDIGPRLFVGHRDAGEFLAFRRIGGALHFTHAQLARSRIDAAHAAAEAGIHHQHRIDALGVEPRQPGPHFDVDDDFPGPGAGETEIGKRDLFAGAAPREAFPPRIFRGLHAMAGIGDDREIPFLGVLDQVVHRIDDTLPRDLPVQNGDRVDAILFERRCDIHGVGRRASQLRPVAQIGVMVHSDHDDADRSSARRAQNPRGPPHKC